jgi:hypothetical protein
MTKVYSEIGEIASDNWNKGIRITINTLAHLLNARGYSRQANRGLFSSVSAAYRAHIRSGQKGTADCIACAITNAKGRYCWQ